MTQADWEQQELDAQEALFDGRADTFCLVTSDSDFAYLCRKLRERGATVHIVAPKADQVQGLKHLEKGDTFAVDAQAQQ